MPPIRRPEERIATTLGLLSAGTLGGTLRNAARPVTPVGELRTPGGGGGLGGLAFYFKGPLVTSTSIIYPAGDPLAIGGFTSALRVAGSTGTEVDVEVNGTAVDTFTVPASSTYYDYATSVTLAAGDRLQLRIVTAGTAAEDLTVVPRAA
jgi:hypothetical protein